jgi:hypothetical protein
LPQILKKDGGSLVPTLPLSLIFFGILNTVNTRQFRFLIDNSYIEGS